MNPSGEGGKQRFHPPPAGSAVVLGLKLAGIRRSLNPSPGIPRRTFYIACAQVLEKLEAEQEWWEREYGGMVYNKGRRAARSNQRRNI